MRLAVNGAAGAMGRRVVCLAGQGQDCQLVAALERAGHPDIGKDIGLVAGAGPLGVALSAELTGDPHVLVDFSVPEASLTRARECAQRGIAVLVCTTGLSDEQRAEIEQEVAAKVPVIVTANTSLGINLMFELAVQVARALGGADYDIEIVEAHHRRKKDAPSGTAKELARRICEALERDPGTALKYGREGIAGPRRSAEIGVHAVRGGDIAGEHTVMFAGQDERLELTHRVGSRDVFARGALRAAAFLTGREPGLYTMADVLA